MDRFISEKWIKRIVAIYFYLYAAISCLLLLLILIYPIIGGTNIPAPTLVGAILAISLTGGISYGLKKRIPAVPFFLVLFSGVGIVSSLIRLDKDIFFIIAILFDAFSIYFFSLRDVRKYFGTKGHYFV